MRFTTLGGWASVGPRGFAAGGASYIQLKLAASDDTPYVAYSARTEGGKATVATLVDGVWSYLGGAGFSTGEARYLSLALTASGKVSPSVVE
jgi:hypothetical protein